MPATKTTGWQWFKSRCLPATQYDLEQLEKRMAIKLSELDKTVEGLQATVEKIWTEQQTRYDALLAEFNKLKEQLDNVELPPATESRLNAFAARLKEFDDTIPDTTP